MYVPSRTFEGKLIKTRHLTLMITVQGRLYKKVQKVRKMLKNTKFYFWQVLKCDTYYYNHVSIAFEINRF